MKRLLIGFLAMSSIVFTSATAFADATLDTATPNKDIDVNVNYEDGTSSPTVYSVDIVWESMEFTYNAVGTKEWDADKHEYVDNTEGAWNKETADITVTNHSNAEIEVIVTYNAIGESGVTGTVENGAFSIQSAVGLATDAAELSATATLKIGGAPEDKTASALKIGTVTVSFLHEALE